MTTISGTEVRPSLQQDGKQFGNPITFPDDTNRAIYFTDLDKNTYKYVGVIARNGFKSIKMSRNDSVYTAAYAAEARNEQEYNLINTTLRQLDVNTDVLETPWSPEHKYFFILNGPDGLSKLCIMKMTVIKYTNSEVALSNKFENLNNHRELLIKIKNAMNEWETEKNLKHEDNFETHEKRTTTIMDALIRLYSQVYTIKPDSTTYTPLEYAKWLRRTINPHISNAKKFVNIFNMFIFRILNTELTKISDEFEEVENEIAYRNYGYGGGNLERHYVVTSCTYGEPGGRYSSKSGPAAAARKAASKRLGKNEGAARLRLTVRETGTSREFTYDARRVKLEQPAVRIIGGKQIVSKYRVDVKAVRA